MDSDIPVSQLNENISEIESPGYSCTLELSFDGSPLYFSDTDEEQISKSNSILKNDNCDFNSSFQVKNDLKDDDYESLESDDDCNGY